jgi:hypothetical protein
VKNYHAILITLIAGVMLGCAVPAKAADITCVFPVIVDVVNGKEVTGVSNTVLKVKQKGNISVVTVNGSSLPFQVSPVRNDKWKAESPMQMEHGEIDTGNGGKAALIIVREKGVVSAVQYQVMIDNKTRRFMGVDCK